MTAIDARAILHAGGAIDALALQHHGIAVAMWQYWESRYQANPTHPKTVQMRRAWRDVVKATEEYYELERSFESRSEIQQRRPR